MRCEGFSLLEVVVAIAVSSMILISVFLGFSSSLNSVHRSYCASKGAMIAQKYSSLIKAGFSVTEKIKEGNYVLQIVDKKYSGFSVKVIIVHLGGIKCTEFPVK